MEPPDEAALLKSMLTTAEQVLSAAGSGSPASDRWADASMAGIGRRA